jgi:hypothetical protein
MVFKENAAFTTLAGRVCSHQHDIREHLSIYVFIGGTVKLHATQYWIWGTASGDTIPYWHRRILFTDSVYLRETVCTGFGFPVVQLHPNRCKQLHCAITRISSLRCGQCNHSELKMQITFIWSCMLFLCCNYLAPVAKYYLIIYRSPYQDTQKWLAGIQPMTILRTPKSY